MPTAPARSAKPHPPRSPRSPRTKPPEARRDELIGAAQRLFLAQGVAPTTIEQITQGAKVAKGTFYLYFSSKEDLLAALGDRFAQTHLGGIEAALAQRDAGDWPGRLSTWVKACALGHLDAIKLHDTLFREARKPTREGLVENIVIDHLSALLRAGTDAGAWAVDAPDLTAVFLFSALHGAVDHAYLRSKRVNRTRLAQELERLCRGAIGV